MTIIQRFKNAVSRLQLWGAMSFRGQNLTTSEAALAFNIKRSQNDALVLKMHEYPELKHFLTGFLNSAAINGKILGENLTFVVGAEGIGKSTQIQTALTAFRKIKTEKKGKGGEVDVHKYVSPQSYEWQVRTKQFDNQHFILIKEDYAENPSLNFECFIDRLHQKMIEEFLRLNKKLGDTVLDSLIIRDVLLAEGAEQHWFVYLKDVVFAMINECDPIYIGQQNISELEQLNIQIIKLQAYEFFQGQMYPKLISFLAKTQKQSPVEACIRLFVSIGKRLQYEHRDSKYQNSWFVTGIQSTNVLFDLLNFVCGFGSLNKLTMEKYFQTFKTPNSQKNWILEGNRADVALCLMNLEKLYIWDSPELWNFLDHVISRTAVAQGLRNHFPIIIELPNGADLQQMNTAGQMQMGTVPFVQVPGYLHHTLLKSGLSQILPHKIINRLFNVLGKTPAVWSTAIEQLGKETRFTDIINGNADFIQKQAIVAEAKFNRVFTTIEAQQAIYNGTIIPQLIQHLRVIRKGRGLVVVDRPGLYVDFISRPLFQALQRVGITYHHYYLPHVDMSRLSEFPGLMKIKNHLMKDNWVSFWKWRFANRDRFSLFGSEVKYKSKFEDESIKFDRHLTFRDEFHLGETYYGGQFNYTLRYGNKGLETDFP